VVPGHGDHGGRTFAETQAVALGGLVALARQVHAGDLPIDEAVALTPFPEFPAEEIRRPLQRALRQLRGELD
jgi:hypothetical protein